MRVSDKDNIKVLDSLMDMHNLRERVGIPQKSGKHRFSCHNTPLNDDITHLSRKHGAIQFIWKRKEIP